VHRHTQADIIQIADENGDAFADCADARRELDETSEWNSSEE
jgi:hypothetical protein